MSKCEKRESRTKEEKSKGIKKARKKGRSVSDIIRSVKHQKRRRKG